MLQTLEEHGPSGVFEDMRPKLFGATTHAERPAVVEYAKGLAGSQTPAAIEGAIRAMLDRPDSTPLLGTIAVPTLIVVGQEDALTPPAAGQHAAMRTSPPLAHGACFATALHFHEGVYGVDSLPWLFPVSRIQRRAAPDTLRRQPQRVLPLWPLSR
jgi:pimeloyl-ACP methyl ester carboxylesterase